MQTQTHFMQGKERLEWAQKITEADTLIGLGKCDEAVALCNEILSQSTFPQALSTRAKAFNKKGDHDNFLKDLNEAKALNKFVDNYKKKLKDAGIVFETDDSAAVLAFDGIKLFEEEKYDQAIKKFSQAFEKEPFPSHMFWRAKSQKKINNVEVAILDSISAVHFDSKCNTLNAEERNELLTFLTRQVESSVKTENPTAKEKIQLDKEFKKGQKFLTNLKFEEAIACFTKVIALDNLHAAAYCERGYAHYLSKELGNAFYDYQFALWLSVAFNRRMDFYPATFHERRRDLYAQAGHIKLSIDDHNCIKVFEEHARKKIFFPLIKKYSKPLKQHDKEYYDLLIRLAKEALANEEYEKSAVYYCTAEIVIDGEEVEGYLGLSICYRRLGRLKDAKLALLAAQKNHPTSNRVLSNLKALNFEIENLEKKDEPKTELSPPKKSHTKIAIKSTEVILRKFKVKKQPTKLAVIEEPKEETTKLSHKDLQEIKMEEKKKLEEKKLIQSAIRTKRNKEKAVRKRKKFMERLQLHTEQTPEEVTKATEFYTPKDDFMLDHMFWQQMHQRESKITKPCVELTGNEKACIKKLSKSGKTYLVGGAVRQRLLDKRNRSKKSVTTFSSKSDVDFVTSLSVKEVVKIISLDESGWTVVPVYHGCESTKLVRIYTDNAEKFDIWCSEEIDKSLEMDAKGRDFTVNALYVDIDENVLDPTGRGLNDLLQKKKLVTIRENAEESFADDPIRILRARCVATDAKLDLTELEPAIKNMAGKLMEEKKVTSAPDFKALSLGIKNVKTPKLNHHLAKVFTHHFAALHFEWMVNVNLIDALFPTMAKNLKEDKQWILNQLRISDACPFPALYHIYLCFVISAVMQQFPDLKKEDERNKICQVISENRLLGNALAEVEWEKNAVRLIEDWRKTHLKTDMANQDKFMLFPGDEKPEPQVAAAISQHDRGIELV